TPEITSYLDDPFAGISDDDISDYGDLYDVPPPDNDDDARKLGIKIQNWIKQGRPNLDESSSTKIQVDDKVIERNNDENEQKQNQKEKPKKKRGLLGFFRK
ncbi:MAG: signal recognition particle-docking protein FtsY, partial [Candidatus Nitrosomaritimum yanchengensis]